MESRESHLPPPPRAAPGGQTQHRGPSPGHSPWQPGQGGSASPEADPSSRGVSLAYPCRRRAPLQGGGLAQQVAPACTGLVTRWSHLGKGPEEPLLLGG